MKKTPNWSEDEIEVLKAHYEEHGHTWPGWESLLPGRTSESIRSKARSIGLTSDAPVYEGFTRARPMEPVDRFVLSCLHAGMTVGEIDEMKKWVPGKAKRILMDIWRNIG